MAQCDTWGFRLETVGVAFSVSGIHEGRVGPSPES
jgi:hypothetical protein